MTDKEIKFKFNEEGEISYDVIDKETTTVDSRYVIEITDLKSKYIVSFKSDDLTMFHPEVQHMISSAYPG